uniref:Glycosyltransferase n=1 Tax=viral metagenome TaxID=1070528 RepID=A0A6C0KTY7_9ZZZZ
MRKCYILTCDIDSERSQFSKKVLEKVGFNVIFFKAIPNENKVLSNKNSMLAIYDLIANGEDEWVYVFEDDINILEDITIDEIIEYEKISNNLFYLGVCMYEVNSVSFNKLFVNKYPVAIAKGSVRGLHSIALSKNGASELLKFSKNMENYFYMDMILEQFTHLYPANVVRYDLESYIKGHRGVFFQDRARFPSTI